MDRRVRHLIPAIVIAALAGCSVAPSPQPLPHASEPPAAPTAATLPSSSPAFAHGDQLDVIDRPDGATCDATLRSEKGVAAAIRDDLHALGIPWDPASVEAAAVDPEASTEVLGIPFTPTEQVVLHRFLGTVDPMDAMKYWVVVGAPDRFGGLWFEAPGSGSIVVGVVDGDPETLALARCLERGVETRYVWAALSLAEGLANADRIGDDHERLQAEGVDFNGVSYRPDEGTVVVFVDEPTPELEELFLSRYGPPLRLEQGGNFAPF